MIYSASIPYRGRVTDGKFIPQDPKAFKAAFYRNEGKVVVVTVKRWRPQRSNPMNAYYWCVVVKMIGDAIGESDTQAVHEMLKCEHNYSLVCVGEKEIRVPQSTAALTVDEFQAYLERIYVWSASFISLYIPKPNEVEI